MSEIKLLNGDCLELMKDIPDKSVDMILTDPPYGTTACKWDSVIPFDKMWEQLNRIIKNGGAIVLFGSEPFSSLLRCSNLKNYKYDWVWLKSKSSNFLNAKKQPLRTYENICVFYGKQCVYNPQMTPLSKVRTVKRTQKTIQTTGQFNSVAESSYSESYPKNILEFKSELYIHPTQKPVALLEYLIKTYTLENETVLDFTMGSGSTGVACKNTNRNFIGIELDKNYFDIATKRIENGFYYKEISEDELKNMLLFQ